MMKYTKLFFLSLVLLLPVSHVMAEDTRYYDIEIVIFQNTLPGANSAEDWPSSIDFTYPESSLFIGDPYPGLIPGEFNPRYTFKPVIKSGYKLLEEAKLLENSQQYRVLYHRAWRQPGLDEKQALAVKIRNDITSVVSGSHLNNAPYQYGQTNTALKDQLFGSIKVILKRYLHVEAELYLKSYKQEAQQTVTGEFQTQTTSELRPVIIDLKESRKMRSKELHYLDNPVLGMLVYITPFENK